MFVHLLINSIKTMLKNKESLLWTLLFPIALGTFMYMAFGNLYETDEIFKAIPVAIVEEKVNENFAETVKELSKEGENQLLDAKFMSREDADKALLDKEITGIIIVNEDLRMIVNESSLEETVVKTFLNQYLTMEAVIEDIVKTNPAKLSVAMKEMMSEDECFKEISTSNGNQDVYTNYFYAIFAMSSLFSSFAAVSRIVRLQPNTSALGMRRNVVPARKWMMVVAEYIPMVVINFLSEILILMYFTVLGVDFGSRYPQIVLLLLFGTTIGISLGVIVGALPKISEDFKSGICVAISMACSVLADLCASGIKDAIQHSVPIINKINPAALIVDSFYALNVCDTYDRYIENMVILGVMSVAMLGVSIVMLRRNRYASL